MSADIAFTRVTSDVVTAESNTHTSVQACFCVYRVSLIKLLTPGVDDSRSPATALPVLHLASV